MDKVLKEMFSCLEHGDSTYLPSRFWEVLNDQNVEQLESGGYDNFKQTIAGNYFTWPVGLRTDQFRYLLRRTSPAVWPPMLRGLLTYDGTLQATRRQQFVLHMFTVMMWKFAEKNDRKQLLNEMEEPSQGNPVQIRVGGKFVSQDLANAILEYYAIVSHFDVATSARSTICELGAGYGRNAYVFAKALPRCRYIVVDIPPALYVAQRYLSSVFPERRVFEFRCFEDYCAVEKQLEEADFAFLLPHQAALLPEKSVDLFINISSLHEMKPSQIDAYIQLIGRLTKGFFYTKQWFVSKNPHDNVVIKHTDYPIPASWRELYLRPARVQTTFFEAMYAIQ